MIEKIYTKRFEVFFFSKIAVLFGSLIIPIALFEDVISPILFQINLLAGILLISKKRKLMWFFIALFVVASLIHFYSLVTGSPASIFNFLRMIIYFLFYVIVTLEIIAQVWRSKVVNEATIFGMISGFISLGLLGFFICLSIEMAHPKSFAGLLIEDAVLTERLIYFSYINLSSI